MRKLSPGEQKINFYSVTFEQLEKLSTTTLLGTDVHKGRIGRWHQIFWFIRRNNEVLFQTTDG